MDAMMAKRGYLEGRHMATTFNMLRANDLIWSFVINNYLLGKEPFPFDLLYWNSDSTRMPYAMHSFYLRKFYQENRLVEPGGITLGGVPIDLRKIRLPVYLLSTREDHIAPWALDLSGDPAVSGPEHLRARGLWPHRRRDQPAERAEIRLLDQSGAAPRPRRLARRREPPAGLLVAALAGLECRSIAASLCRPASRATASCRCSRTLPAPTLRVRAA